MRAQQSLGLIRLVPEERTHVLWSIVSVAVAGILLGLNFRVPALLAATALIVAVTGLLMHGPLLQRMIVPVLVLQCAYVAGLALGELWRRMPTRR